LRTRLVERRRTATASGAQLSVTVRELVDEAAAALAAPRRDQLAELILRDTVGLGPL
jgi:hypothetical protein